MIQFFDHESEGAIINKKDTFELKNWITHLEYFKKELDFLQALLNKYSKSSDILLQNLEQIKLENSEELSNLYNYAPSIADSQECDDVACDIFYLNKHEDFRKTYLGSVARYRDFKDSVYEALLK